MNGGTWFGRKKFFFLAFFILILSLLLFFFGSVVVQLMKRNRFNKLDRFVIYVLLLRKKIRCRDLLGAGSVFTIEAKLDRAITYAGILHS